MEKYGSILIIITLLAPLGSAVLSLIIPAQLNRIVAPALLLIASISGLMMLSGSIQQGWQYSMPWFVLPGIELRAGIVLDKFSGILIAVVSVISFLVHLYSTAYMKQDGSVKRYYAILGLFTFAMIALALADNLLLLFVFWELVGFCSYLLIGHWNSLSEAGLAARKSFLFNRIGDAGFLAGLLLVYVHAGTFEITALMQSDSGTWQTAASILIFLGIMGKSAQLPLFTWLPDAMAGPTPVSALIHAATMVAAGVYLFVRIHFLFTPDALMVTAWIGGLTALTAALMAFTQYDIKRILAYSTISQLGLMVVAAGTGNPEAAFLHLFTHAFFKAGLFLAAGSIIHSLEHAAHASGRSFDYNDIRNMGGLRSNIPFTTVCTILCGSSLAGIPFFSGFLSKEAILHHVWNWSGSLISWKGLIALIVLVSIFLTAMYMFRLVWFVFFSTDRTKELSIAESPLAMKVPMGLLAGLSLFPVVGLNPFHPSGWFVSLDGAGPVGAALVFLSLTTALFLYKKRPEPAGADKSLITTYPDRFYSLVIGKPVLRMADISSFIDRKIIDRTLHATVVGSVITSHMIAWIDKFLIDGILVKGSATLVRSTGNVIRSIQGGLIQKYILWGMAGLLLFLFWLIYR